MSEQIQVNTEPVDFATVEQQEKAGLPAATMAHEAGWVALGGAIELNVDKEKRVPTTEELPWEKLPDGQNKMGHIITDLPPNVFQTFAYNPNPDGTPEGDQDTQFTEEGELKYSLGFNATALGDLEPGSYRMYNSEDMVTVFEIVADENGDTNFDIRREDLDPEEAKDYRESAGERPKRQVTSSPYNHEDGYLDRLEMHTQTLMQLDRFTPKEIAVYTKLGFTRVGEGNAQRLLSPSPQKLEKYAQEHNIPIKLIASQAGSKQGIEPGPYVGAFAEGKFPVDSVDLEMFFHDIGYAHLPEDIDEKAARESGEAAKPRHTLLTALAPVARLITPGDIREATGLIDDLTQVVKFAERYKTTERTAAQVPAFIKIADQKYTELSKLAGVRKFRRKKLSSMIGL